jgi:WD40 repeat protein
MSMPGTDFVHDAFISYSRKDRGLARALKHSLEAYRPPRGLPMERRKLTAFLDETDFTGTAYEESVDAHLRVSRALVVVCSPDAAQSPYVNDEIRKFWSRAELNRCIIPVLYRGLPTNELKPGQENEGAFPQALCELLTVPLGVDYRGFNPAKDHPSRGAYLQAWYMLLANLLGVSRAQVEERDRRRKVRTRWIATGITAAVIATLASALVFALVSRRQAIVNGQTAIANGQEAGRQRDTALQQTGLALQRQVEAERQRKIALARQLAAQAELFRRQDPRQLELAGLLALESLKLEDSSTANATLREILAAQILPVGRPTFTARLERIGTGAERGLLLNADSQKLWLYDSNSETTKVLVRADHIKSAAMLGEGRAAAYCSFDFRLSFFGGIVPAGLSGEPCTDVAAAKDTLATVFGNQVHIHNLSSARTSLIEGSGVTLSPNGKFGVVAGHGTLALWSLLGSPRVIQGIDNEPAVTSVVFGSNSALLAVGHTSGAVEVMRTSDGVQIFGGFCHEGSVNALAISDTNKYLLSGGSDGAARLWTIRRPDVKPKDAQFLMTHSGGVNGVAFGPLESMIASGGEDGIIQFADRRPSGATQFALQTEAVRKIAFAGTDLQKIVSIDKKGFVRSWRFADPEVEVSTNLEGPLQALVISPDGKHVAANGFVDPSFFKSSEFTQTLFEGDTAKLEDFNRTVFVWDFVRPWNFSLFGPDDVESVNFGPVRAFQFSSDGKYLRAEYEGDRGRDEQKCWRLADGKELDEDQLTKSLLALFPASKKARRFGSDDAVKRGGLYEASFVKSDPRVLDVRTARDGKKVTSLRHVDGIRDFVFSPSGEFIATASGKSAIVWRMPEGKEVTRMTHRKVIISTPRVFTVAKALKNPCVLAVVSIVARKKLYQL